VIRLSDADLNFLKKLSNRSEERVEIQIEISHNMEQVLLFLLLLPSGVISHIQGIRVNPKLNSFVDDKGRTRIWHGTNFVEKVY
jgi:hypothetical protein